MSWDGKKVLVTGGEGFVGSHLVEALLHAGADVRVLTHYKPYGRSGWLEGLDLDERAGDVRDQGFVRETVKDCDVVFHLAALIGIPYSYIAPESYVQVNVVGTTNVVAACRDFGVKMVHTSTSEVYGTARTVPISEAHLLQPQSPYSASKIGADCVALSYHHAFGTEVVVARPFNVYGPRQSSRAIIPSILAQLHRGVKQIKVGNTLPTRDMNYVTDTVSGFLAIGDEPNCVGGVWNIGTGIEVSIETIINMLCKTVGVFPEIVVDEERVRRSTSEVERLVADSSLIREYTEWRPVVDLHMGLAKTSEWVRDNLSRFDIFYAV